jgi:RNA polymerase sigma factor (sigma-70 family)
MLTIEELNQFEDISGSALYSAEVRRLPRMTREEEKPYIEKARRGDKEAQDIIVMTCLNWTIMRAVSIYEQVRPTHLDVMDLAGVGYLEMMEKLDRALEVEEPIAYLMTTASWQMQTEATFNDSMIMRPRMNKEEQKKRDPYPAYDVSLEQPHNGRSLQDVLTIREVAETPKDFTPLYQAVEKLNPVQRRTIIDNYGLYGQPALPLEQMAQRENKTRHNISSTLHKARRNLATKL